MLVTTASRSTYRMLPRGAALLQTCPTSALSLQRQLHTPSSLRQQVQTKVGSTSNAKPDSGNTLSAHVSEEVLKDRAEPGWAMGHSRYTEKDLDSVKVVHRKGENFGDSIAAFMVGAARMGFDIATRYPKHRERFPRIKSADHNMVSVGLPKVEEQNDKAVAKSKGMSVKPDSQDLPEEMELGEMRRRHLCFSPEAWLTRIVFLESIAGVPGMVAASVRHLQSLRLLRRDKGWIKTLLEDASNERMHLLVALKLYKPGLFMRTMLLLAQGVFYNFFFLFYLVSPRVAHRFVGILEEEAVVTYSRICDDIVKGRLPEWEHYPAPQIAKDYWSLNEDAKILDVMRALRSDEANHRYINHTLANLETNDYNPFAYGDAPPSSRGLTWGLTREEAIQYFEAEDAKRRHGKIHSDEKGPFQGRDGTPV